MPILLQEDIDVLVREGVIAQCGSGYIYAGFAWGACSPSGDRYTVYEYNEKFYKRAYLSEVDDRLQVTSETDTGGVDMRFVSREAAMKYIRGTYARLKAKVLELKNAATIKAIDRLE